MLVAACTSGSELNIDLCLTGYSYQIIPENDTTHVENARKLLNEPNILDAKTFIRAFLASLETT